MRKSLIIAFLASFLVPVTSHAQLFVSGGVAVPVSPDDISDVYNTGFGATAGFAIDLPLMPITPRLFGSFDTFSLDDDELGFDADGGNLRAIAVGLDALFTVLPGPLSPYIAPAAGLTFLSLDDVEAGGIQFNISDEETAFTLGMGAGVMMNLLVGPKIFLDGRLLYAFTSGDNFVWAPVRLGVIF